MPSSNQLPADKPSHEPSLRGLGMSNERPERVGLNKPRALRGEHLAEFEHMSREELFEQAKQRGVRVWSEMTRPELLEALRRYRPTPGASGSGEFGREREDELEQDEPEDTERWQ